MRLSCGIEAPKVNRLSLDFYASAISPRMGLPDPFESGGIVDPNPSVHLVLNVGSAPDISPSAIHSIGVFMIPELAGFQLQKGAME